MRCSNLQNDGQYERPLGSLLVEKLFQVFAYLFLDDCPVAAFFNRSIEDGIGKHLPAFDEQPLFLEKGDAAETALISLVEEEIAEKAKKAKKPAKAKAPAAKKAKTEKKVDITKSEAKSGGDAPASDAPAAAG